MQSIIDKRIRAKYLACERLCSSVKFLWEDDEPISLVDPPPMRPSSAHPEHQELIIETDGGISTEDNCSTPQPIASPDNRDAEPLSTASNELLTEESGPTEGANTQQQDQGRKSPEPTSVSEATGQGEP